MEDERDFGNLTQISLASMKLRKDCEIIIFMRLQMQCVWYYLRAALRKVLL